MFYYTVECVPGSCLERSHSPAAMSVVTAMYDVAHTATVASLIWAIATVPAPRDPALAYVFMATCVAYRVFPISILSWIKVACWFFHLLAWPAGATQIYTAQSVWTYRVFLGYFYFYLVSVLHAIGIEVYAVAVPPSMN